MLRTNCKEVNEKIKSYLMDGFKDWYEENVKYFDGDLESLKNIDANNYTDVCNSILLVLFVEKIKHDNRRNKGQFYYFEDWCQGLCSVIDTSYFYNVSAVDLLGDWLEETEEEKAKYDERKAESTITHLLYREITRHANRTGILC